jgi:putative Holliday junction resolvase
MGPKGRLVGIDYGTKRVGLAVSDPLGLFAQPVGTFTPTEAIEVLGRVDAEDGIDVIVIGWPLEENGSHGKMTGLVAEYIRRLKKRFPDVEFIRRDERYSSEHAKELIKAGQRPSLRKTGRSRIDTAVAGMLLQGYLDETSHLNDA